MVDPCLISTSDGGGGAAIAAYRLHRALRAAGVGSRMLVQEKRTDDPHVYGPENKRARLIASLRPTLDQLPAVALHQPQTQFTTGWLPDRLKAHVTKLGANIVNLHEIRKGNLRIESLARLSLPIVWTLHDMWALTGGCHYDQDCGRYMDRCGRCPLLDSRKENDLSRRIWQRKMRAWRNVNLTVVSPSRWLADCAARSSLFAGRRIEVIPNGLDTERYRPLDRSQARSWLQLPQDKKLLLFLAINASSDKRKGYAVLHDALASLHGQPAQEQIELVVAGASAPSEANDVSPFRTHYLGHLHDDISLALAYAAADAFVAPSMQDNLPNTVLEAMACATPCLAFEIGGMPDLISHQRNGYLAPATDADALVAGIRWLFAEPDRCRTLGAQARRTVERGFTGQLQAQRYHALYADLLNGAGLRVEPKIHVARGDRTA